LQKLPGIANRQRFSVIFVAMNWQQLNSSRRSGSEHKTAYTDAVRTSFVRDYDRLIFSSAFRRLQNKTQVFPLPGPGVFVHNRLTHSLEVASVGRSLGKAVGDAIAQKYPHEDDYFREFYKYVATRHSGIRAKTPSAPFSANWPEPKNNNSQSY
jgi:dGTP triphosphohydrolase